MLLPDSRDTGTGQPIHVHIHYHNYSELDTSRLEGICEQLCNIERKVNLIMATEAEFSTKINRIEVNTTKSAAAATALAGIATALKTQLDQVLTDAGVPAAVEAGILSKLDVLGNTSEALATFLEQTASTPAPAPEPTPVPVPVP